jgi:hypothetical protein
MTKENVKWSTTVKTITLIASIALIIAEYYMIHSFCESAKTLNAVAAIVIALLIVYFLLEAPLSLEISETQLTLNKIRGNLVIEFSQIAHIDVYKPNFSELRLFGSGGFFGYIGIFRNSKTGNYRAYVGDYSQSFLIQTQTGIKYVLSCENRDAIVQTIKKYIHESN